MKAPARFVAAVIVAGAMIFGVAAPANAVDPILPPPGPVNVLPSVVRGAVQGGTSAQNLYAALIYRMGLTATQGQALKASAAGVATAAQAEVTTATKAAFRAPATKPAALVKGGIGVMMNLSTGLWLGDVAAEQFGYSDDQVCASNNGVLEAIASVTNGVDCTAYSVTQEQIAQANADASAGYQIQPLCIQGTCFEFVGYGGSVTNFGTAWCFDITGPLSPSRTFRIWRTTEGNPVPFSQSRDTGQLRNAANDNRFKNLCNAYAISGVYGIELTSPTGFVGYSETTTSPRIDVGLATADPVRHYRCTLQTTAGDVSALSLPFHETDESYSPIVCPDVPEGGQLEGWKIDLIGGPEEFTLVEESVTPEYAEAATLAPECMGGACPLELEQNGVSCFDGADCEGWFEDPDKASSYTCRLGSHVVDLAQCNVYAPTWNPQQQATGQTYGDWEGKPMPNPQRSPEGDTPADRNCWSSAWGDWNPLTWVLLPIKCGYEWAFIPSTGKIAAFQSSVSTRFTQSAPGKISEAITAQVWPVIDAGGCGGFTISLAWMKQGAFTDAPFPASFSLLGACEGTPMYPFARFANLVLSAGIIFVAFKTWPALIGRVFTYGGVDG